MELRNSGVDVVLNNIKDNPVCPHGPTILFSKIVNGERKRFFACSACRDKKACRFFVWEHDIHLMSNTRQAIWNREITEFLSNINHRKLFIMLNKVKGISPNKWKYCSDCLKFALEGGNLHVGHTVIHNISEHHLSYPSEILPPLDNNKKEAQYLFSKRCVEDIICIFQSLKFKNIICVGTPRIHEYVRSNCLEMNSLLLDIDKRFHNFFGPLEFCWYNSFNNHFFFNDAKRVFHDFLQSNEGKDMVLITDPPFGGRTEPLSHTIKTINSIYKKLNKTENNLPVFWIFPYFMEPQIKNSLSDFSMSDYKVEYDNHTVFQSSPKGRKQGSPVRIFTNLDLRLIKLPDDNYKYCKVCEKWVAMENKHCNKCNSCTSKDGRTYKHCNVCKKCVKPSWQHCNKCKRCALASHKCSQIIFQKECFNCKEVGHKKSECPQIGLPKSNLKSKNGEKDDGRKLSKKRKRV